MSPLEIQWPTIRDPNLSACFCFTLKIVARCSLSCPLLVLTTFLIISFPTPFPSVLCITQVQSVCLLLNYLNHLFSTRDFRLYNHQIHLLKSRFVYCCFYSSAILQTHWTSVLWLHCFFISVLLCLWWPPFVVRSPLSITTTTNYRIILACQNLTVSTVFNCLHIVLGAGIWLLKRKVYI